MEYTAKDQPDTDSGCTGFYETMDASAGQLKEDLLRHVLSPLCQHPLSSNVCVLSSPRLCLKTEILHCFE